MKSCCCLLLASAAALIHLAVPAGATEWYVGPNGTTAGMRSKDSPWDIASALAGKQAIKAGDTVFLLGGIYRRRPAEQFEAKLIGAEGKPIHVRPAPGQRASIDGGLAVHNPSAHLWVWDLEIFVGEPQPEKAVGPGSHPKEFTRPWDGLHIFGGQNCKFINLVIHECRQGVSWWSGSRDCELHGCLIYDNGWPATDRGHLHAIMTGGHSYTVHAYGSSRADVDNYLVEGNICYQAGPFLSVSPNRPGPPSRQYNPHSRYRSGTSAS